MSCCGLSCFWFYSLCAGAIYFLYWYIKKVALENKLERWNHATQVVVHAFPASKVIPNISPFVLKLETFLRLAGIKYELDTVDSFGPKTKTPWISYRGHHVADSHFAIQFLKKQFSKDLNGNYSKEQLAKAAMVRLVLEEHAFWGAAFERFDRGVAETEKIVTIPYFSILKHYILWMFKCRSKAQGIGYHSQEEILGLVKDDLRYVSDMLGDKPFICGDEMCEDDCSIFGFIAQVVWGLPNSPYQKYLEEELPNLKHYCYRVKEKLWPDWENRCAK